MTNQTQDIYLSSDSGEEKEDARATEDDNFLYYRMRTSSLRHRRSVVYAKKDDRRRESMLESLASSKEAARKQSTETANPFTETAAKGRRRSSQQLEVKESRKPMTQTELTEKTVVWLIGNQMTGRMLQGLQESQADVHIEVHLLRLLGELFTTSPKSPAYAKNLEHAKKAVTQFETYGKEYGIALQIIFNPLLHHLKDPDIVNMCLFVLLGAFEISSKLTLEFHKIEGCLPCMLDTLFEHVTHQDVRSRTLKILRWLREEVPYLTIDITKGWEARRRILLDLPALEDPVEPPKPERRWTEIPIKITREGEGDSVDECAATGNADGQGGSMRSRSLIVLPAQQMEAVHDGARARLETEPLVLREEDGDEESSEAVSSDYNPCMAEDDLPGDMELFRSVLRVHHYFLKQGQLPVQEVAEPMHLHSWDREVVIVGLTGLAAGGKPTVDLRTQELAQDATFPAALLKAVVNFSEPDAFRPALKLIVGMLHTTDGDREAMVEAAAATCQAALNGLSEALKYPRAIWEEEELWSHMMEAMDMAYRERSGPDIFAQYDILAKLGEVWNYLQSAEDDARRLITKNHKGGTEFVIQLMSEVDEASQEDGEEGGEEDED